MNRGHEDSRPALFTVGHSNHTLEGFLDLVRGAGIELIVDVRSSPYSRYVPHFNKKRIEEGLSAAGIDYVYRGDLLGGRPGCRGDPVPLSYPEAPSGEGFREGIRSLLELSRRKRCAVMCAERDPGRCHRRHLIAPALIRCGARVVHILADGTLLPEEESGLLPDDR